MAAEDDKNELDELFEVKNSFYIGNYQHCIHEASKLKRLSPENVLLKELYVYRCFILQKKYKLVLDELKSKSNHSFESLRLLAQYYHDPSARESIIKQLPQLIEKSLMEMDLIVAATIFMNEKEYENAFRAIYQSNDLECLAQVIQIYIQMHRLDLAKETLTKMQNIDEDSTLTQLSVAWINIAWGADKAQEAFYILQEFCDKYTPSVLLLNGLAACHIHLQHYEEAESCLREALEKDSSNPDTLVNLIVTSELLGKGPEITQRFINQLKDESPEHPFVKEYMEKEEEYDKLSKIYLESMELSGVA